MSYEDDECDCDACRAVDFPVFCMVCQDEFDPVKSKSVLICNRCFTEDE